MLSEIKRANNALRENFPILFGQSIAKIVQKDSTKHKWERKVVTCAMLVNSPVFRVNQVVRIVQKKPFKMNRDKKVVNIVWSAASIAAMFFYNVKNAPSTSFKTPREQVNVRSVNRG